MRRLRVLALVAMVVLWVAGSGAAERPARSPAGTVREPVLDDEPEAGEGGDEDPGDDGPDEGRALPSEPDLRAPSPRPAPRGEEEEPPPPGERSPTPSGPAEPASAAQPLSPG